MELNFFKYEGAGNDFILIDGRQGDHPENPLRHPGIRLPNDTIRLLCERRTGIGADGLMVLRESADTDFTMEYHNADGGEVSMCGNGGRCIALFARHLGIVSDDIVFTGRDGVHRATILSDRGDSAVVKLGMTNVEGYEYSDKAFFLNTGVPHYVEFVDDLGATDVVKRGREIRRSERFNAMGGTNVDFVQVLGHGRIALRTYERGVEDETHACGTGAVAAAIATHLYAQGDVSSFAVDTLGGTLDVGFTPAGEAFGDILLTGLARRVFAGTVMIGDLTNK